MSGLVTVKVACPVCGPIALQPRAVLVRTWSGPSSRLNRYEWACPKCKDLVVKPAPPDVVELLVDAGVPVQHVEVPDECDDPHRSSALPPLTEDDVLDLLNELDQGPR